MNLPESIQVGGYSIKVVVDSDFLEKLGSELGKTVYGYLDQTAQTITLGEYSRDFTADTLLHEILHMCFRVTGCWINQEVIGRKDLDVEERIIDSITNTLLDTLRRNPELTKYLLDH